MQINFNLDEQLLIEVWIESLSFQQVRKFILSCATNEKSIIFMSKLGIVRVWIGACIPSITGNPLLERLDLSGNQLQLLSAGLLDHLPKLVALNVSNNRISHIPSITLPLLQVKFFLLCMTIILIRYGK